LTSNAKVETKEDGTKISSDVIDGKNIKITENKDGSKMLEESDSSNNSRKIIKDKSGKDTYIQTVTVIDKIKKIQITDNQNPDISITISSEKDDKDTLINVDKKIKNIKEGTYETLNLVLKTPRKRVISKGKLNKDELGELTLSESYEEVPNDKTKMKYIKKDISDPKNPKDLPAEEKPMDEKLFT